mgnify:CR=1 FL=1
MSIIKSVDVKKWYGDFQALKGISMDVAEGEVLVIAGPSGSGKSTFIRCINRLEQHQDGQIFVDGIELTNDLKNIEAIRSEVGMVFQSFNLFPHLTVLQNITLAPIWVRKKSKTEAEEKAMEYFNHLVTLRTKTVANNNGLGRSVVHIEKDFGAIDEAMSKLPKLMRNLINKIKSGVVPCEIAGEMKEVTATKARNENIMIAALQAFDPANSKKNNFTTTSVSVIKDILGLE